MPTPTLGHSPLSILVLCPLVPLFTGTSFPYDPRCPFETDLQWPSSTCLRGWTPSHAPLPAGVALTRFDLVLEIPDLRSFEAPAVARSLLGPDLSEQCLG